MRKFKKLLLFIMHNPSEVLAYIVMKCGKFIPDRLYLQLLFRLKMGRKLNLKSPEGFNQKIQWLKLYDRDPSHTGMVDKYEVKNYVSKIIGEKYIIPTLGVWDRFDDIDFRALPNRFVLKTTNGGGGSGVVICKDKTSFDKEKAKRILKRSLKANIYHNFREWPYMGIRPHIIAEKYMEDTICGELIDYKFFCFNGYVDCVMVCSGRQKGNTKFYFFDKSWKLLRLNKLGKAAPSGFTLPRPLNTDEMFAIASELSKGIKFVRVDLYSVDGATFFGELTFFPDSGFDKNLLSEADNRWGRLIDTN